MNPEQVDAYWTINKKLLPNDKLPQLREAMLNASEEKFNNMQAIKLKNPTVVYYAALFLGQWGVDRFMLGQIGLGLLKLATCGGAFIWDIIDFFTAEKRTKEYNFNQLMQALM
jgi:TM2 domain-containing membrane protein YozV